MTVRGTRFTSEFVHTRCDASVIRLCTVDTINAIVGTQYFGHVERKESLVRSVGRKGQSVLCKYSSPVHQLEEDFEMYCQAFPESRETGD